MGVALRENLLKTSESMTLDKDAEHIKLDEDGVEKKYSLGQILRAIKDAQRKQANIERGDDFHRIWKASMIDNSCE